MPSIETIAGSLHDIGHPNEDHDKRAVEKMFMNAMLGKWPAVADTYANRKAALVATIIHTGDTVLHLAVSSRVEFNVTLLMGNIPEERFEEILGMGNDRGDTPLHLAAALGMKKTCSDMATRCPKLVTQARDEHGETPLFKAARHGQKEAFGAMRHAAPDARSTCDLHFCRKFGGDTILHVALLGEHYGTMPSIETIAGSLHDIGHPNEDHDKRAVEKMFMNAMLGKWPAVADTYANRKAALVATIIHTGDTVLHLAVSSRVEFNVTLLMGNIPEERFEEILGMGNDRGDTPLHLAAALGMKKTCSDMATRCPKLVTQARDEHGETPLFKAARHGQKEAFGAMRHAAPDARSTCDLHFCRKFGGDTILHVALLGEHYGLWTTAIEAKKQRKIHVCARQIMIELLKDHREWDFGSAGRNPDKKRSDWLRLSRFSPEAVEVRRVATGFPTEESKGPSEEKQLAPSNEGPVGGIPSSIPMLYLYNSLNHYRLKILKMQTSLCT
ncbi:putative serine/threonine-protein phosphatase 6 regulatory ankyrin repeat subunit B-like [Cocos nucifera]|nr:putative serine/threonine-protein phosphatase 6 regulatory ankyrin repeat subunit B-like [Cocos nucifera]